MQNLRQVRVVDPVLSRIAFDYMNAPSSLVGGILFPRVPVTVSGGQRIEFGKEAFRKYNTRRAPGGKVAQISFGYAGKPFSLYQDAFDVQMPIEHSREAQAALGIDLGAKASKKGGAISLKNHEDDCAAIATNPANYAASNKIALSAGTKWSAATGTPIDDIENGKEAVRQKIGMRPNAAVFSAQAWTAFRNNPQVIERYKYTNSSGPISKEWAAALLEVKMLAVGDAVTATDQDVMSDIWGNNVILAYTAATPNGDASLDTDTPSFGLNYAMEGHPLVMQPYWDDTTRSWMYPFSYERVPLITADGGGYLIQNPK